MVVEKRALLNVMVDGQESMANPTEHSSFNDTFEFIRFLTEQDNIESLHTMGYQNMIKRIDNLVMLYCSSVKKYIDFGHDFYQAGREKRKQEMLHTILKF